MKDLKIYIVVASLLLAGFLYIHYNRPAPVNWAKTYAKSDKIPYGTYILYQELSALWNGIEVAPYRKRMYNTIEEMGDTADHYLVIAPHLDIDETDYRKLIDYLTRGNDVFLAAYTFSPVLADSLKIATQGSFRWADSAKTIRFTNPELDSGTGFLYDKRIESDYFAEFDTLRARVLATDENGNAVFLRHRIGKGNLYTLSSPDYFTNYALLTSDGAAFAERALSYLNPPGRIIWDDYQALGEVRQESPLRFFLSNKHLRPAYFLALFSLLAFVLYNIKRRQRVIPVMEPLKNTSIEFAKVVSSVYYERRDNRDILAKQYTHFLAYIRETYRVETGDVNTAFMQYIAGRSGVDETILLNILQGMHDIKSGKPIDDKTLTSHYRSLENFYKHTSWKSNISNNAPTSAD